MWASVGHQRYIVPLIISCTWHSADINNAQVHKALNTGCAWVEEVVIFSYLLYVGQAFCQFVME